MTSTSLSTRQPHIVLIPGYWLGAWAWDEVIEKLTSAGALATALTLPGLDPPDPQRAARTLDDQAEAIAGMLDQLGGDVVLVGHSGANGPVSLVLDRHPELIRRVIWVDSGPMANDGAFAPRCRYLTSTRWASKRALKVSTTSTSPDSAPRPCPNPPESLARLSS